MILHTHSRTNLKKTINHNLYFVFFSDSRGRGGHRSHGANNLGGCDSVILQSLGKNSYAVALSA